MFPARKHHRQLPRALGAAVLLAALVAAVGVVGPTLPAQQPMVTYVALGSNGGQQATDTLAHALTASGGKVRSLLPVAGAVVVRFRRGSPAPSGVTFVPDERLHLDALSTGGTGPADTVRSTVQVPPGVDGRGITVAVLDTGVAEVGDLAGRLRHITVSGTAPGDGYGHGTFMAGLIAGSGSASGGQYEGVAPAADVLDVKAAAADGSTSLSEVLAGLQAVAEAHAQDPSVRVLNLSLSSGTSLPPNLDPLARALDSLWRQGVTAVVSAGNSGPATGTVTSPGDDPTVLTVGSLNEQGTAGHADDTVSSFSSRGPTATGAAKPDLVAPGAHLVSLRDPGSVIDTEFPSARVGTSYFRGSGTSMAAAVVSGVVADLLSVRPDLRPDDVKALLTGTAYTAPGLSAPDAAGSGGIDLTAALAAPVPRGDRGAGAGGPGRGGASRPPAEADAPGWATFATAWQQGDYASAARSWAGFAPATRSWAARSWATAVWADAALSGSPTLLARSWAARSWAARSWAARSWAARSWAADGWLARSWAARSWASTDWAARSWAARSWAGYDWSARSWASTDWAARSWAVTAWADSSWSAAAWLGGSWAS